MAIRNKLLLELFDLEEGLSKYYEWIAGEDHETIADKVCLFRMQCRQMWLYARMGQFYWPF